MVATLFLAGDSSAGHGKENHEETQILPSCRFHFVGNLKWTREIMEIQIDYVTKLQNKYGAA